MWVVVYASGGIDVQILASSEFGEELEKKH